MGSRKFDGDLTKVSQFFRDVTAEALASPIAMITLVKIMGKVKKPAVCEPAVCGNCKAAPCMSGTKITTENFVPDADIKFSCKALRPHQSNASLFWFRKDEVCKNLKFDNGFVYDC